jgi:pro-sigmaK processing inhibitor BofA
MIQYIILAAAVLILLSLFWSLITKIATKATVIIVNSAIGLVLLYLLNNVVGFRIPIELSTVLVCGVLGIPGILSLALLHLFGTI